MESLTKNPQWPFVLGICQKLKEAGFEAWLAGGCVRDGLLNVAPKDFDVATNAKPEKVEVLFPKTVAVGKAFGVIRVVDESFDVEVATFRHDKEYKDGRRPEGVVFCTPEEDALRRDFTINALFYDPVAEKIYDFVDGKKDLGARVIRAVGDPSARFKEDHLRLLRALRFAAQLDFEIDPQTYKAIRNQSGLITAISKERIREELSKMLLSRRALKGISLADETGLLFEVLPELRGLSQVKVDGVDEWTLTKALLEKAHGEKMISLELAWMILLHAVDGAGEVLERLHFSNKITESILQGLKFQKNLEDSGAWRRAQMFLFLANPHARLAIQFFGLKATLLESKKTLSKQAHQLSQALNAFTGLPEPLVVAEDLFQMGMKPGKELGEKLRQAFEAQLNLEFGSKLGALDWIKKKFRK